MKTVRAFRASRPKTRLHSIHLIAQTHTWPDAQEQEAYPYPELGTHRFQVYSKLPRKRNSFFLHTSGRDSLFLVIEPSKVPASLHRRKALRIELSKQIAYCLDNVAPLVMTTSTRSGEDVGGITSNQRLSESCICKQASQVHEKDEMNVLCEETEYSFPAS